MSERQALALAALLHLLLLGLLSLGLARPFAADPEQDVTPIEFVEVADVAQVTEPPRPSMEAAPREPEPPAAAAEMPEAPPAPMVAPQPPAKATVAPDTAAQDAIAEAVAAAPPQRTPPARAPERAKAGQDAALVDRRKAEAPVKPRETADFAKVIEDALPKSARLSPIQAATLEQAIRAQIAPCWNPPIGGADVAEMTAVLRIRLNRDGTVAAAPEFVSQTGATAGNQAYARAFVETARRAVLRCAPLQLPGDLYAAWREFELNFDPRLMT
jgi:hypothetical protein